MQLSLLVHLILSTSFHSPSSPSGFFGTCTLRLEKKKLTVYPHSQLTFSAQTFEVHLVTIRSGSSDIVIVNIYRSPSSSVSSYFNWRIFRPPSGLQPVIGSSHMAISTALDEASTPSRSCAVSRFWQMLSYVHYIHCQFYPRWKMPQGLHP